MAEKQAQSKKIFPQQFQRAHYFDSIPFQFRSTPQSYERED